jgi:hypothetical protein
MIGRKRPELANGQTQTVRIGCFFPLQFAVIRYKFMSKGSLSATNLGNSG